MKELANQLKYMMRVLLLSTGYRRMSVTPPTLQMYSVKVVFVRVDRSFFTRYRQATGLCSQGDFYGIPLAAGNQK